MQSAATQYELLGYLAALGSAAAWAVGSILFRKIGEVASPVAMNLVKCMIGAVLLAAALALSGGMEAMDGRTWLVLGVSGLLGIAVGDTFFFEALVRLGPRLTVLLGVIGPVLTIVLAVLLLDERITAAKWFGVALVLLGVNIVLWTDAPAEKGLRGEWLSGVVYALLAAVCMSLGIVAAKVGVAEHSALQGTLVRVLFAGAGLALWGAGRRELGAWLSPFKGLRLLRLISLAVFVVIFGGFWLSLVALQYAQATVATILNSMEPIFVLPLVAVVFKEKVPRAGIAGAIIAVLGVSFIFSN